MNILIVRRSAMISSIVRLLCKLFYRSLAMCTSTILIVNLSINIVATDWYQNCATN